MALPAISWPSAFDAEPNLNPPVYPGRTDELVIAPDGLPARVVKAHNAHKKHFIERYAGVVAVAMKNKWGGLGYVDTYCGPGMCWVKDTGEWVVGSPLIALGVQPAYSHFAFVDKDSVCVDALERREPGQV